MTIATTTDKVTYTGNGSQLVFPYTFKIFSQNDLRVTKYDTAAESGTVLTLTTDYTVSGVGLAAGGDVTLTGTAPSSSYQIIIERYPDFLQALDLIANDPFPASSVEDGLDKIVTFCQRLKSLLDRCMVLDASNSSAPTMPAPETGKYLYAYSTSVLQWAAITALNYAGTFASGNDASKSASPSVKDIYVALDTGKIYYCATAGTWTEYTEVDGSRRYLEIETISQTSYNADIFGMTYGAARTSWIFQSFTPSRDMYISQVSFYRTNFSPLAATRVNVAFESDTAGAPSGSLVSGSSETTAIAVTLNEGWKDLALSAPVYLAKGSKYWLRLRITDVADGGFEFGVAATQVLTDEHFYKNGTYYDRSIAFKLLAGTYAAGDVVKITSTNVLAKAKADTEANSNGVIGIVQSITTGTYGGFTRISLTGSIVSSLSALTPGSLYYLDPTTEGALTATKPTTAGQYVKPVLVALTATTGVVINQVGTVVPAAADPTKTYIFWENSEVAHDNEEVYLLSST